jgi:hypothetical protein
MTNDGIGPPVPRRSWQLTLFGADADRVIATIEAAGYVRREPLAPGSYSDWRDVEPRQGTTSSSLYVVEDPARPILDRLVAEFGA